jgi:hypothetical protein
MAMETQDQQHQRRWKPRIYSTRDEHSNHYTTDVDLLSNVLKSLIYLP